MKINDFMKKNKDLKLRKYTPQKYIVYFVCDNKNEILYIGSSKNSVHRLYSHVKDSKRFGKINIYYFESSEDNYREKERELIAEIKPELNTVGNPAKKSVPKKVTRKKKNIPKSIIPTKPIPEEYKKPRYMLNVDKIKKRMVELDLTPKKLARIIRYDEPAIIYLLQSEHTGPKTLSKVAGVLDLEIKEIIKT